MPCSFQTNCDSVRVFDIPTNPYVIADPSHPTANPNEISDPSTAQWATLLYVRYRILLLDLVTALSLDRTTQADLRNNVIATWAVGFEMSTALAQISKLLTAQTRAPGTASPRFAGPSFAFGEALPGTACGLWKDQLVLLQRCTVIVTKLLGLPGLTPKETDVLTQIQTFDGQRLPQIQQLIQQNCH